MITINAATFAPFKEQSDYAVKNGWIEGTVEVAFMSKTRHVECRAPSANDGEWIVFDLCARYATGTKVWPATVKIRDGKIDYITTGFESRSGRHSRPRLCGFLQDVCEQHVSKR